MYVGQGSTKPADWQDYDAAEKESSGIMMTVDTSAAKFQSTPHYLFSLEGDSPPGGMYAVAGINAIYDPTPTSFKVYLRWADTSWGGGSNVNLYPRPIRAAAARNNGWHITWTGIQA